MRYTNRLLLLLLYNPTAGIKERGGEERELTERMELWLDLLLDLA